MELQMFDIASIGVIAAVIAGAGAVYFKLGKVEGILNGQFKEVCRQTQSNTDKIATHSEKLADHDARITSVEKKVFTRRRTDTHFREEVDA